MKISPEVRSTLIGRRGERREGGGAQATSDLTGLIGVGRNGKCPYTGRPDPGRWEWYQSRKVPSRSGFAKSLSRQKGCAPGGRYGLL